MDGQPAPSGTPLPLLARIGRARKPAEATATRRDGTAVNLWRTLGSPRRSRRDPERVTPDVGDWRPWP